ncbi:MAG: hypothetical protein H6745_10495 [Deltaproteobacteria bacterium]|nr:hypothetical protein [Deltaproteobacteria bacterium]
MLRADELPAPDGEPRERGPEERLVALAWARRAVEDHPGLRLLAADLREREQHVALRQPLRLRGEQEVFEEPLTGLAAVGEPHAATQHGALDPRSNPLLGQ